MFCYINLKGKRYATIAIHWGLAYDIPLIFYMRIIHTHCFQMLTGDIYIYIYIYNLVCMYVCVCNIYIYIYIYIFFICVCVCIYACVCVCVYIYIIWVCMYLYEYMFVCKYVYIYLHTLLSIGLISRVFTNGQTGVQSQFVSYQRLKKWYLMPPCLVLSIIRWGSSVKCNNFGNAVAPSPTLCSSNWKRSHQITLD